MARPAVHVVIDARPRGPRGLLAGEVLLGRSVFDRLLDQALRLGPAGTTIDIFAREDEHALLERMLRGEQSRRVLFFPGPPRSGAVILRTDRLYDLPRLRRAVRRGADAETAAIWRLDQGPSLATAEEELKRRLDYQPLGRYWAFPLAEALASRLEPTAFRPNHLTLAAAGLMLAAAVVVAFGTPGTLAGGAAALAMAAALVLDTADGRLARLQGTSSAFGRWLDQVLDELADLVLHAAIAWSLFRSSGQAGWLAIGMLYLGGKSFFLIQSITGEQLTARPAREGAQWSHGGTTPARQPARHPARARIVPLRALGRASRKLVAAVGHADLRWHLWIILAAAGRLDIALAVYAAYFPARAIAGVLRKAVTHA